MYILYVYGHVYIRVRVLYNIFCYVFQKMRVHGLALIFYGATGSVFFNEKTNDITGTNAKWLASFVINLEPFNRFLAKLDEDIRLAMLTAGRIMMSYNREDQQEFRTTLSALRKEVIYLNETRNAICQGVNEYQLMPRREKRSLIPIIG